VGGANRLILELDAASRPIAGRIGPRAGRAIEFSGYMDLIAALEALREPDEPRTEGSSDRHGASRGGVA
jgi:hypothetical protein